MIQFHRKWINLPCLRNSESRYSYSSLEPEPDLQVYRITSTSTSNRSGMYTVYNIYIYTRRVFRNAEKNNPAVEIESRNKYVINSCVEQRYRNAKIRSARAIEFTRISVGYNGGRINDYRAYFYQWPFIERAAHADGSSNANTSDLFQVPGAFPKTKYVGRDLPGSSFRERGEL